MLFICLVLFPFRAAAETLDEYVAKAEAAIKSQREASNKKTMTEGEKKEALAQKDKITKEISSTQSDIDSLENEIKGIEDNISNKNTEIKSILSFIQISSGESAYLEYAFGAKTFTDFIYRVSVAEQLSDYNNSLINSYNEDIKSLSLKQKDLSAKQNELNNKQTELSALVSKLSKEIDDLSDTVQSYSAEYENLMSYVNELKKMGCKGSDTMASCKARQAQPPVISTSGGSGTHGSTSGSNSSNSGSNSNNSSNSGSSGGGNSRGFYMPLTKGRVTQNYYGNNHNAIDMSNYEGAPIYAVTAGVVRTISHASCGKNIVYIVHNVDGRKYTTVYYHLKSVNVSRGQVVSYNTQIGTQGGNPSYDSCTTGSHLDFKLFNGEYLTDFFTLSKGPHIDPRNWLTQAPGEGKWFYSR